MWKKTTFIGEKKNYPERKWEVEVRKMRGRIREKVSDKEGKWENVIEYEKKMEDKWKKMRKERERDYEHRNNWRKKGRGKWRSYRCRLLVGDKSREILKEKGRKTK